MFDIGIGYLLYILNSCLIGVNSVMIMSGPSHTNLQNKIALLKSHDDPKFLKLGVSVKI